MWHKMIGIGAFLFLSLTLVTVAAAQGPTADEVNRIAKKLYCPVCPNTPLDVCQTQACVDWRAQIRDMLAEGKDEQAIIDYFVAEYGVQVLAAPPRRGFTALVWILPLVGLGVGGWILAQGVQRRGAARDQLARASSQAAPQPIPADYLARLEEDVRKG